jgi:hypothetical protein
VLVRRIVRPAGPDPFLEAGLVRDPVSDGLVARERTALYEAVDLFRAPGESATLEPVASVPTLDRP